MAYVKGPLGALVTLDAGTVDLTVARGSPGRGAEMATETLIAWTDATINFWMGCTKISEGCRNCYAATLTKNRMGLDLWGPKAPRQVTKAPWATVRALNSSKKTGVLGPGKPSLAFVGSLMDWAEDHPALAEPRAKMWDVIRSSGNIHFQLLTKRPENIRRFLPADWGQGYPNVWLGTSIEDMRVASRADQLRGIPAAVRFISYEPALGPLDALDLTGIDWVIFGGESGPGFRPMDLAWPRAMREKCAASKVAFFFKQSAAYRTEMGTILDGESIKEYPVPRVAVSPLRLV